jgi:F-type H+-transporting ATPase subunit b
VRRLRLHSRWLLRILWLAALVVLAGPAAVRPIPLAAQQPDVTAPEHPKNPPRSELAKQEEEGDNAYRHSELVQSLAKLMHLPVETAARTFEIINIAIVVLGIGVPLARFLPKYLRNRKHKLSGDLEEARKQTEDANSRLTAVEARLSHLDEEIAKFRAEMENGMRQDEARIKASLEEDRARIVASVEQEIGAVAAHARRGLRHFAADLAIEQAAKQIAITPETDRALIAEFVRDLGNGGGKN